MSETQKITIKDLSFLDKLATTDQEKLSGGQAVPNNPNTYAIEIEESCLDIVQFPNGDIIVDSVCPNDPSAVNVIPSD